MCLDILFKFPEAQNNLIRLLFPSRTNIKVTVADPRMSKHPERVRKSNHFSALRPKGIFDTKTRTICCVGLTRTECQYQNLLQLATILCLTWPDIVDPAVVVRVSSIELHCRDGWLHNYTASP
jgi:hypothetical protein